MSGEVNPEVFGDAIVVVRGSATTPGLYFSGDTSRGIYSSDTSLIDIPSSLSVYQGSSTTPAIFFSGRTNVGIYSSDTSTLDCQVGSDGTFAIHSILSVDTIFVSLPSSATTGGTGINQVFFTVNNPSGFSIGVRSGDTIYYLESSLSTTGL